MTPSQSSSSTYFEATRANLRILKAYLENGANPKEKRVVDIADFLQANLRRAMHARPERERDVQDTLEKLLIGRGLEKGVEYDREVGRVKFSSKEFILTSSCPLSKRPSR